MSYILIWTLLETPVKHIIPIRNSIGNCFPKLEMPQVSRENIPSKKQASLVLDDVRNMIVSAIGSSYFVNLGKYGPFNTAFERYAWKKTILIAFQKDGCISNITEKCSLIQNSSR
jgi:hypothetical protein